MGCWYNYNYGKENITVSTRVRLARNLEGIPFPSKMTSSQKQELCEMIKSVVKKSQSQHLSNLKFIYMADVPENERFALFERHIISKEFASNFENRAIIISDDESVAIMIGEEDHIRIQVINSGFLPEKAYEIANEIDNEIIKKLPISYDDNLGFLTECPTNLGTGLRVSVMLHLPFLEANNKINSLAESLNKIGFTIRGMYGEGTKALSSFYQISNQVTLGISEENAIENLRKIISQVISAENVLREKSDNIRISDRCFRALYTLKGAKILESSEMMRLISDVMLGINMGIIDESSIMPIKLLIECGPYMLMSKNGDKTPIERDILRAKKVSESIIL